MVMRWPKSRRRGASARLRARPEGCPEPRPASR